MSVIERYIGGESGRRSLFGGSRHNKTRRNGVIVSALVFAVAVIYLGAWGLVGSGLLLATVLVLTTDTRHGTVWQRRQGNTRRKEKKATGTDVFRPVSRRPAHLEGPLPKKRAEKKAHLREWNTYRDWPDGLEGLQWLQDDLNRPGVAWHTPTGETPYLSVVWPLAGQIRGLESDLTLNAVTEAFGRLLESFPTSGSLATRAQLLTRVLPPDTAAHETWLIDHIDREMDEDVILSYAEVVNQLANGSFPMRHYAVIRWDLGPEFIRAAARRDAYQRGWLRLMDGEIEVMHRRLAQASLRPQGPLTARQVAAVFRHMQMPSWPIDQAGDLTDPMDCFLEEHGFYDHTVVTDQGPDGTTEQWHHRTARINIRDVETGPRTALWMLPLLSNMGEDIVRTVAFEHQPVPARQARTEAREDLTMDLANMISAEKRGSLIGDDLEVTKLAVEARVQDLKPGSGVQGDYWCMHLTISTPTRDTLIDATEKIRDAAHDCGIEDLDWLDDAGQAGHANTFPIARAMAPIKLSTADTVRSLLAGRGHKEALK